MKRLVYAPKVYIFIRSSNLDGRIYDVSSDVVRGSVTQNIGDVSTASFELRNRYQKWIRDPDSGNKSIFLPMDMVTIWLQRVAGRPIQVFTGYLDEAPYYQGYPGNAIFEASCTLKKLAYTWFDPGLEFFTQWVRSADGWVYDPSTGEAQNPTYNVGDVTVQTGGLTTTGTTAKMHDGGFGELLGRFMVEVAGWDSNDVLISDLPPNLPKSAAKLYSDINKQSESDLSNLATFLGQAMGVKGYNAPTSTQTDPSGNPTQQAKANAVMAKIAKSASVNNVPVLVLALAAYVLSGFEEKYNHSQIDGVAWGYGLYALRPKALDASSLPGALQPPPGTVLTQTTIDGHTPQELLDATTSTNVFCNRLNKNAGYWVQGARNNDLSSMKTWIEKALGRPLPKVDMTAAFEKAKQYSHTSVVVTPNNTPSSQIDQANVDFNSPQVQDILTDKEKQIVRDFYGNADPWLAAILYRAKQSSAQSISVIAPIGTSNPDTISLTGPQTALTTFFKSLIGDTSIDAAELLAGNKRLTLIKGVQSSNTAAQTGSDSLMSVHQSKKPPSRSVSGTSPAPTVATDAASSGTADPAGNGGISLQQLAAFSANSAFAANFAFPANYAESKFLTGNRALMNDVSCLDAAKQFCQASLRAFRSLPDGRFLAFYPDYFGAYRKPYWKIHDIEMVNFGIQLNDKALATHVYVVGDTFALDGKIDMFDEASTRGVATLTQAFMLDSFIEPYNAPSDAKGAVKSSNMGRLADAWQFLQHYGARPHKEEQPLIHNTFYEFLIAWQRFMQLWASQFATTAEFTFQPEVMAGGLIEFPDHDIQMYCDSVTHNFDYEAGFSTQATLMAPALTSTNNDKTQMPGFALAGGVNTVGAISG